jgi:hypothetical protein
MPINACCCRKLRRKLVPHGHVYSHCGGTTYRWSNKFHNNRLIKSHRGKLTEKLFIDHNLAIHDRFNLCAKWNNDTISNVSEIIEL